jgi:hypothetical protein
MNIQDMTNSELVNSFLISVKFLQVAIGDTDQEKRYNELRAELFRRLDYYNKRCP